MRYALCNETFAPAASVPWAPWKFEDQCRCAARLGYHALELAPFTFNRDVRRITPAERAAIRKTADSHGLKITGLHWLLAQTEGFHLTTNESAVRESTARYTEALMDFCADVGGKIMVWGSPKQRSLPEGVTFEQGMERAVAVFKSVMPWAKVRGITIAIEPLARTETNFINTAAQGRELVRRVGDPRFALHLDVKAMSDEGTPIPDIIRASRGVVHYHANDPNLRGPGTSGLDHRPFAAALREIGYDGYISIEVFKYDPDPETIAREGIEYLKKAYT
ncbi:MAG: sugar phosphate isomerase/epimerase [Verrucomicrobia bacterium]|nr:sugar phosphate isomerase/epimerase [Verrucomicrobiota bacterium]